MKNNFRLSFVVLGTMASSLAFAIEAPTERLIALTAVKGESGNALVRKAVETPAVNEALAALAGGEKNREAMERFKRDPKAALREIERRLEVASKDPVFVRRVGELLGKADAGWLARSTETLRLSDVGARDAQGRLGSEQIAAGLRSEAPVETATRVASRITTEYRQRAARGEVSEQSAAQIAEVASAYPDRLGAGMVEGCSTMGAEAISNFAGMEAAGLRAKNPGDALDLMAEELAARTGVAREEAAAQICGPLLLKCRMVGPAFSNACAVRARL